MSKFKVGDRVVCLLRTEPEYRYDQRTAVVIGFYKNSVLIKYDYPDICDKYHRAHDYIEHAHIYDSPLYRALL